MDTIAKQDVHWDRIPVEGNLRRFQFRCLLQNTVYCSSWQNPEAFRKHFEGYHQMIPESARRGRPGLYISKKTTTCKKTTTRKISQERSTDMSSGHFSLKWWRRKKYQMSTILQKVVKQQSLKGERDSTEMIKQSYKYYEMWKASKDANSARKRLADSTIKYWTEQGFDLDTARDKGKVPENLDEFESEDEIPSIERDGEDNFKIGRRKLKTTAKITSPPGTSATEFEKESNEEEEDDEKSSSSEMSADDGDRNVIEVEEHEEEEPTLTQEPAAVTPKVIPRSRKKLPTKKTEATGLK